jgi:hypothetical protein
MAKKEQKQGEKQVVREIFLRYDKKMKSKEKGI